jgi:hypothetical protein
MIQKKSIIVRYRNFEGKVFLHAFNNHDKKWHMDS